MIKESKKFWKNIVMEEYYTEEEGIIYCNYRFPEINSLWNKQETAMKDIPYVVWDQKENNVAKEE